MKIPSRLESNSEVIWKDCQEEQINFNIEISDCMINTLPIQINMATATLKDKTRMNKAYYKKCRFTV